LAFATSCAVLVAAGSPALAGGAESTRPYVVVYDTPAGSSFPVQAETAARERAHGFGSTHRYRHAIDGFAARLTADDVRALRADPDVALVSPDRKLHAARVPVSPTETIPNGVARIGGAGPTEVHAASGVTVAVLDTGIDLSNPDLAAHPGSNCTGTGPPEDDDPEGHGTFVAGIIGARNTGVGVVGVAPGTQLYAVKVLGADGTGYVHEVICGIDWVTANAKQLGIRVANMSLSHPLQHEALHLAVKRSVGSGIVYTAAAGNADPGGLPRDIAFESPGSYPEVLTVTAASDTDGAPGGGGPACEGESDDTYATFSNFATRPADIAHVIAAPGVCIESTARGGGVRTGSGTSASAPHVAGVVALCIDEGGVPGPCAEMTPAEVVQQIRAEAAAVATPQNGFLGDPFSPLPVGHHFGHLASAHDLTVRRIPPRPAPVVAASPPAAADTTLEVLALLIARRQQVDKLRAVVRLAEPGTATARARVRLRAGAARLIASRRATVQAKANRTYRLRLALPRGAVARIKRALRRGVRVRARVTVTVNDSAGNSRTKQRRVRLRR
jgi:subtilisin family serine protease